MAKKNRNKPVVELEKTTGKIIKYFESAKSAADTYNISPVYISYNVKGVIKHAKGHVFRFATQQEIRTFEKLYQQVVQEETQTSELPSVTTQNEPVETIPERVDKDANEIDTTSNFQRLLETGKKKLIDNSK